MTKTATLVTLASMFSFHVAGAVQASDITSPTSLKPQHALTFEAGDERGVTYFVHEKNQCKVVLTLAKPSRDDARFFTATRYEITISSGKVSRYQTHAGKDIEFVCGDDAQAMTVQRLDNFAGSKK